jgi:hypothetical protein
MTHANTGSLRLGLLIFSAVLLAAGVCWRDKPLAVAGGAVYFAEGAFSLLVLYAVSKRHRAGTLKIEEDHHPADRARKWVEGVITLFGLLLTVITHDDDFPEFLAAGWLIWGGAIAFYLISGWIIRGVAGIPLYMSHYGGWKPGHEPRRRR